MNNGFKLFAAATLAAGFALPAAAHEDVMHLVCGEFLNMQDDAKINASTDILVWISDNNNAEMVGNLVAMYPITTEPKAFIANISEKCIKQPYTTNIVSRMQEPH